MHVPVLEDEHGVLFDCTMHAKERNIYFEKIKTKTNINFFDALKHVENLKLLFKSDSPCSSNTNLLKIPFLTGKKPKY